MDGEVRRECCVFDGRESAETLDLAITCHITLRLHDLIHTFAMYEHVVACDGCYGYGKVLCILYVLLAIFAVAVILS